MNLKLNQIKEISTNRLKELYGDNIDQSILDRYTTEIKLIENKHYEDNYFLAYLIIQKAYKDNEIILLRGNTSYPLIAYLLNISNINPIKYNIPIIESKEDKKPYFEFEVATEYVCYIEEYQDKVNNYNKNSNIKFVGNDKISIIKKLEDKTGIKHTDIFEYTSTLKSIRSGNISKLNEFNSIYARQIIEKVNPQTISDYINIYGMIHGTDIWRNNNENLISTHNLNELICTRDDIFTQLIDKGIKQETAYNIMELAGKGRISINKDTWNKLVTEMKEHNIQDWYITSLENIKYTFPKAHCYTFTYRDLWLAWYEVNYKTEFKQIIEELKIITYKEVEERLKNVKLEDMTSQDVFDRYIGYGDNRELNNIEIQKLLLKHNYIEYLISSVETIITDKTVIEKITSSDLFKDSKYHLIRGRIENIEIMEDKELPKGFEWLIVNLQTQAKEEYKLKYMYYPQKQESYKNQIERNMGNDLIAVTECKEKEYRLCCFLK